MNDHEIAIIKNNVAGLLNEEIRNNGIEMIQLFSNNTLLSNCLKRILACNNKLPVNLDSYYNKNIIKIKQNTIILYDTPYAQDAIKWIKKFHSKKRIIIWYWNPVNQTCSPNKITNVEKWSYSPNECKKYNMLYNTTYYFKSIQYIKSEIIRDVFFVGLNKKRMNLILDYKKYCEKNKITCYFHVSPNKSYLPHMHPIYKNYISYQDVLKEISKSKAILDLYTNKYSGLSLRTMEALFFRKKLITNHVDIQNYDFYNKNNIFILGQDNIEKLKDFINSPYETIPDEIVEKYEFKNWIKRFNIR